MVVTSMSCIYLSCIYEEENEIELWKGFNALWHIIGHTDGNKIIIDSSQLTFGCRTAVPNGSIGVT